MDDKFDVAKEVAKEVAKDIYTDGAKPVVKPSGELVGLIPRTIKAALSPLEKWILKREYNVEETKKLLEEKLKNTPPEQIQSPEPYIAVPAIQYISYCMDNEELRDMYANLLANSMIETNKNGVHPSFVEIIKQLCPDEAKILRYMRMHNMLPTITLRCVDENNDGWDIVRNFSNVGELAQCEYPFEVSGYFDNLIRLGLLELSHPLTVLTDHSLYDPLMNHQFIQEMADSAISKEPRYNKKHYNQGYIRLTDFGESFCIICVSTDEME